ncbi:glycosyltransferase [Breznakiella homolactica]|uniref:Glycosyltransferase n=2 Tax=Breznakiella homolactica TaxID=2798577 RepID=A0A7T8BAW3_9SPIR|nr:glycosyltransferase [Breznakiella homolactica]QQO09801.1 glycosyltransferase [Breznakiella homolactica]
MNREQINPGIIKKLKKGVSYKIIQSQDNYSVDTKSTTDTASTASILNITLPTFRLPDAAGKLLPDFLMNFFLRTSLQSFNRFSRKFLAGTDCFVFESCEGIALIDKIKKRFPGAKIVYRPSDPMVYGGVPERVKKLERIMLFAADLVLLVNEEGLSAYRKELPEFDCRVSYKILSNGIDIESYKKSYPVPDILRRNNTILYVGAWGVEWELLFRAADATPDFNYIVVCPNYPPKQIKKKSLQYKNLLYVPGIPPAEVPAWITNCSVVMVPYETGFYEDRPLGITAKYYQAMAAGKPIVAYHDTPKLAESGVCVTYSYDDFIAAVKVAAAEHTKNYSFNLEGREWKAITERFLDEIAAL